MVSYSFLDYKFDNKGSSYSSWYFYLIHKYLGNFIGRYLW